MPANVETMMYVGRTPCWHGLGRSVENAPNSAEAIIMAGLDWEVEMTENYIRFEDEFIPTGTFSTIRNTDGAVLGSVTDRYQIVQNRNAFSFTDNLLAHDVKYETAGSLNGGKQIWLLARMHDSEILGDEMQNYLVFKNAHDGKGSIQVAITPVRVVCQNTLNLALSTAKRSWATKHMGDMDSKLEEAQITLGLAEEYIKSLGETAENLVKKMIYEKEFDEFLVDLFPMPSGKELTHRAENNILELRNDLRNRYMAEDIEKFRDTQWGVINALSDFVGHKEPLRKTSTYNEKRFESIIGGHKVLDRGLELLTAA